MNTDPQNENTRARALFLQARREQLPDEERRFLEAWMRDHPEAAAEAGEDSRFLDALQAARVEPRPEHRRALAERLEELVREDVRASSRPAAQRGILASLGDLLLGPAAGPHRRRLLLARSLALTLGIVAGVALHLLWNEIAGAAQGPMLSPPERAAVQQQVPAPARR